MSGICSAHQDHDKECRLCNAAELREAEEWLRTIDLKDFPWTLVRAYVAALNGPTVEGLKEELTQLTSDHATLKHWSNYAENEMSNLKEEIDSAKNKSRLMSSHVYIALQNEVERLTKERDALAVELAVALEGNLFPSIVKPLGMLISNAPLTAANAEISLLRGTLLPFTYETERVEKPCPGSHVLYSTMMNDNYCKICGESEDSLGRDLVSYEPTKRAREAKEALATPPSPAVLRIAALERVAEALRLFKRLMANLMAKGNVNWGNTFGIDFGLMNEALIKMDASLADLDALKETK